VTRARRTAIFLSPTPQTYDFARAFKMTSLERTMSPGRRRLLVVPSPDMAAAAINVHAVVDHVVCSGCFVRMRQKIVVIDFYVSWYVLYAKWWSSLPACLKALQSQFWPTVLKFVVPGNN
jgi:hypothetical protein